MSSTMSTKSRRSIDDCAGFVPMSIGGRPSGRQEPQAIGAQGRWSSTRSRALVTWRRRKDASVGTMPSRRGWGA